MQQVDMANAPPYPPSFNFVGPEKDLFSCYVEQPKGKRSSKNTLLIKLARQLHSQILQSGQKCLPRVFHVNELDLEAGQKESTAVSFLSVTFRHPFTWKNSLALTYSHIPVTLVPIFAIWSFILHCSFPIFAMCLMCLAVTVSEGLLKGILKQPRPPSSAVQSYGMPSTHSLTAFCLLFWACLEAATAVNLSYRASIAIWLVSFVVLGPIPWARFHLEDHTADQCVAGSCAGALMGSTFFILRSVLVSPKILVFP